jgi:hypothetical protein
MKDKLLDLARHLNSIARSVIEEDGEHAAMFFLRFDSDRVEAHPFSEAERPVGDARAREMAHAVRASAANAIAFVSEAWSAPQESVPATGDAGDAPEAVDVLLLVALDREGNTVILETPFSHRPDGTVDLGDTQEHGIEYRVNVLDGVRSIWGLEAP